MGRRLSRRELLRHTAAVGAISAVPVAAWSPLANGQTADNAQTLTPESLQTLEAVVARLIPSDANGPGALEAGAAHYIDRALGNALADARDRYATGLAALDSLARARSGRAFAALEFAAQDALLHEIEDDGNAALGPDLAGFLDLVLGHTLEGTFGDPHYGGNRDFIGWDMIGYPGLRLAVGPGEQRMRPLPPWTRSSAYDLPMFESLDPESEFDDG
jgi:gluconate 2-dehydrogenase gamma chain